MAKETVILVHGTFAFHENEETLHGNSDRWWQRGSTFCKKVKSLASKRKLRLAPKGKSTVTVRAWWQCVGPSLMQFFAGLARSLREPCNSNLRVVKKYLQSLVILRREHIAWSAIGPPSEGRLLWQGPQRLVCLL